ncbi:MAG: SufD family Fe-S cluster assembly protein, partial [Thermoproteota archaeon]
GGASAVTRGEVVARAPGARGHIECRGLIMDSESRLGTVPVLRTEVSDAELTHEAAIGRLGEEQIFYLMSRGIPEEEAVSVLVRGFMEVETKGLPEELKERVRAALDMAAAGL